MQIGAWKVGESRDSRIQRTGGAHGQVSDMAVGLGTGMDKVWGTSHRSKEGCWTGHLHESAFPG